jgi:hypothetical protein
LPSAESAEPGEPGGRGRDLTYQAARPAGRLRSGLVPLALVILVLGRFLLSRLFRLKCRKGIGAHYDGCCRSRAMHILAEHDPLRLGGRRSVQGRCNRSGASDQLEGDLKSATDTWTVAWSSRHCETCPGARQSAGVPYAATSGEGADPCAAGSTHTPERAAVVVGCWSQCGRWNAGKARQKRANAAIRQASPMQGQADDPVGCRERPQDVTQHAQHLQLRVLIASE